MIGLKEEAGVKAKAKAKVKEQARAKEKEKEKEKEKAKMNSPANLRLKDEEDRLPGKTSDLFAGSSCEDLAQMEQTAIFGIPSYAKIGRKETATKAMPAP